MDSLAHPIPSMLSAQMTPTDGTSSASAAAASSASLPDNSYLSIYIIAGGGPAKKSSKYQSRQAQLCTCSTPDDVVICFIDNKELSIQYFDRKVTLILNWGMPPGTQVLNPWGDGNRLIYSLLISLGPKLHQEYLLFRSITEVT